MLSLAFMLRLVRRRQLHAKYSILWLSVGIVLVLLAASPSLLDRVSIMLGISYGPTTFFLGAFLLLFLLVIHFSWELSRLEDRSRTLAEEVAILRARSEKPRIPGEEEGSSGDPPEADPVAGASRKARSS
ncbi:MAG: DUF2304 domain-containing protein [Actinomycetota bacterium]|nr:DUF2304 domain-containing protein [Actinomycetota bacterium]